MIIISEKCTGCKRCLRECPLDAISLDGGQAVISEDCTNCGACKKVCPVDVLILEEKPLEGTVECFSCPIRCQIKLGKIGACQRFTNINGTLIRTTHLHTFGDVRELVGQDYDTSIRKPLITAIGAGTVYPDFQPAPLIVQSNVNGIDVVTAVSEAPLSYAGMLIKIDTDQYIGDEGASVFIDETDVAPCTEACPAGIDVPRYIRLIGDGKFAEALSVVREKIPFPTVCGYVCLHSCETKCLRSQLGGSIAIRALKRFIVEWDTGAMRTRATIASSTGKRVAIVGSGPAGLTAAYYLAKLGHGVTVFEALPVVGGMMRVGIPEYRLPKHKLDKEIDEITSVGVEIRTNSKVESLHTLVEQGYDAVLVAIGAHRGQKLPIPGANLKRVLIGTCFLRDVNLGKGVRLGKRVLVLGGGNVAFDCACTALRLGATDVHIACLEPRDGMPAAPEEIHQGEEEGVIIHPSTKFNKILSDGENIIGVECTEVRSFHFDEEGRIHIDSIAGSEHTLPADNVIFAIGQVPELELIHGIDGIDTTRLLTLEVEPASLATGKEGVFAAGDVVTGTTSVIEAIAAGRRAAVSIDSYLGGKGQIDEPLVSTERIATPLGVLKPAEEKRLSPPSLPLAKRLASFAVVECDYSEETAIGEAKRCLRCDLEPQVKIGHVTTQQYGSGVLSIGGPALLTKKGGSAIVRLMIDIAHRKKVALKVEGGPLLELEVDKAPRINGKIMSKRPGGCGSACAGLFAHSFLKAADEVIVIDNHITSLFTKHEAGKSLGARYSGLKLRGVESSPGRYFDVAAPGSGWGGINIINPHDVIDDIDMGIAWPGMKILITESIGERAAMYELDTAGRLCQIALTPEAKHAVDMIFGNCEASLVSAIFIAGAGGSSRGGITKYPVKLTQAIHENKVKLTVGGAPVYVLPGGGINFMVDVSKVMASAFTWVPTPAVVFPLEYTTGLQEYLDLGGHEETIKTLDELM